MLRQRVVHGPYEGIDQTVSLIIRTVPGRLSFLDQALFSIICSSHTKIEVLIVVQSEHDDYYRAVSDLIQSYLRSGLEIKILQNNTHRDERAKNLNLGISSATGRYIGFLDDDDVLYPHHLSTLIEMLEKHPDVAWVYSDALATFCDVDATGNLYIKSRKCLFKRAGFSYLNLWDDNFIPLHSYLIDRSRLGREVIQFNESFTMLEDYAFLLKLAANYPPMYHPEVTCEYRFRMDGSNSTCLSDEKNGITDLEKQQRWETARAQITLVKKEISRSWTFMERVRFRLDQVNIKILSSRQQIASLSKRGVGRCRRIVSPILVLGSRLLRFRKAQKPIV